MTAITYCYHDTMKKMLRKCEGVTNLLPPRDDAPPLHNPPPIYRPQSYLKLWGYIYRYISFDARFTIPPPHPWYPFHQVEIHSILLYTPVYTSIQYMSAKWPRCPVSWQKYEHIFKHIYRYASNPRINLITMLWILQMSFLSQCYGHRI